jgi:hypothetical protein
MNPHGPILPIRIGPPLTTQEDCRRRMDGIDPATLIGTCEPVGLHTWEDFGGETCCCPVLGSKTAFIGPRDRSPEQVNHNKSSLMIG